MTGLRCTYRLQLAGDFGFARARALVPYLRDLGISHLYLPPSFQARPGSTHGYDVVDPTSISQELGGEQEFRALCAEARAAGMGVILDIVPNHMATDEANAYWMHQREKFFDVDPETGRHRRFFDIDHLAGVRQEDPQVFAETHRLALALLADGVIDGLRIDHPDGLADPTGYLERLAAGGARHVWVEKILDPGEQLRDWPVEGTVGYEFLNDVQALFIDPGAREPLTRLWEEIAGDARPFGEHAAQAKLEQARGTFQPECDRLRRVAGGPVEGLEELLSALPVYRTYIRDGRVEPQDAEILREAGLEWLSEMPVEFVTRFQQTTPPVMAKGVEDTAFYRYLRLLAVNDVGGDPSRFGISVADFHAANAERAARFPRNLLITQTHDTKRSGDVRARIGALTAMPERWAAFASESLPRTGIEDRVEGYLVLQTLVGAWPIDAARMRTYLVKAAKEAKLVTSHVDPVPEVDEAIAGWPEAVLGDAELTAEVEAFVERICEPGWSNSLGQKLLQLAGPGVPDVYQGTELFEYSLVDPDNRRPVDFAARRELLARIDEGTLPPVDATGAAKLLVTARVLRLRRDEPGLFRGYRVVAAEGSAAEHAVAFRRSPGLVAVATRLPVGLAARGGWADTVLPLPSVGDGAWTDTLTGRNITTGTPRLADLLARYPVALLRRG